MVFILQTIDGNIVNPRLLSQSIDVHPVLVIVGLLFGSAVGGFVGMMLAVPVASFFKIQFERLVKNRSNKEPLFVSIFNTRLSRIMAQSNEA